MLRRALERAAWPLAVAVLCGALWLLTVRVTRAGERPPLSARPKQVAVVSARATAWRGTREYVGSFEPWVETKVGPQLLSAYVSTVLVRPGAVVKRGDVLATLDCRAVTAGGQAVEQQARALEARQRATASESERLNQLLDGGFASANEVEQKAAQNAEQQAQLQSTLARLTESSLASADCVLRAPFDGEVDERFLDPGAYVRPGLPVLRLVDRSTLRLEVDVPETDYGLVEPGTPVRVKVLATGETLETKVSRRSPMAEPGTRTIRVEMDVDGAVGHFPVGATARVTVEMGEPRPAVELPLAAATVHGTRATVFVASGGTARRREAMLLGEREGRLFLAGLAPDEQVVTQGRATLLDGDSVAASPDQLGVVPPVKAGGLP